MFVEFTGPSSAGKTTLITAILERADGDIVLREDEIARRLRTKGISSGLARTAIEDAAAAFAFLRAPRTMVEVTRAIRKAAAGMPESVATKERLNRLRNAYRHIGMYLFLEQTDDGSKIVILDTGPVHTAHNLFIHLSEPPVEAEVDEFLDAIPLADVVLLVNEDRDTIVERTLERGHRRITDGSVPEATTFTEHAQEVFEYAARNNRLGERLATYQPTTTLGELDRLPDRLRSLIRAD